jgi:nicotinamide riboside kinase
MSPALVVGVLGAESTGKSELVETLARRLARQKGWTDTDVGVVPEVLRGFCDSLGRTPRRDEQGPLAREQARRIDEAARRHKLVLADTTGLMTAIYSEQVFGDTSLYAPALAAHARVDHTLVTALDLPWVPDGIQRDGPAVREAVDALLRHRLREAGIGWSLVQGLGEARVDSALRALQADLRSRGLWPGDAVWNQRPASVADLDPDDPAGQRPVRWRAACDCCSDPDSEAADWLLRLAHRPHHDQRR